MNSAKHAFWYLLSLFSLVSMAFATGGIVFQIINKLVADDVLSGSAAYIDSAMKFSMSTLLIAAPIFYWMITLIHKSLSTGELEGESQIRKWLTYLVLFISSVTMIGWFIGLVNDFLNGELTLKFGLKFLTVLVITAAIFSFYFYDIRRKDIVGSINKIVKIYFYASLLVVLAVFIASFFIIENPAETRRKKADNMITNNFDSIAMAVDQYYNDNGNKLPENLDKLLSSDVVYLREENLRDVTDKRYDYKVVNKDTYQLCATFSTSNKDLPKGEAMYYVSSRWIHDAGYQCLSQKVNQAPILK